MSTLNSNIEIDSCSYTGNTVEGDAGAFEYYADTNGTGHPYTLEVKNSTFQGNESTVRAGVFLVQQDVSDCGPGREFDRVFLALQLTINANGEIVVQRRVIDTKCQVY